MTLPYTKHLLILCFLVFLAACSSDEIDSTPTPNPDDTFEIYTGAVMNFSKESGADENDVANQDQINDQVWITRGNDGGQIFNIRSESSSSKNTSPAGTEWARGTTDNLANLNFASFRNTITPKESVGVNLVLHLIAEDAYLDIKFTSWSTNKAGGFAYERTTK